MLMHSSPLSARHFWQRDAQAPFEPRRSVRLGRGRLCPVAAWQPQNNSTVIAVWSQLDKRRSLRQITNCTI